MKLTNERMMVRLAPDDLLHLHVLVAQTPVRNKSEAVRFAIQTLKRCWAFKLQCERLEVRDTSRNRLAYIFVLEPGLAEGGVTVREGNYDSTLQLRLRPADRHILAWLRRHGVASTDSAVVRAALGVLFELHENHLKGLALFARTGSQLLSVDIPLFEYAQSSRRDTGTEHRSVAEPRDLLALPPGETLGLDDIKQFHTLYPWKSLLIKIDALYDDDEFLAVVEKHLRHGTKLFYVHRTQSTLDRLSQRLRDRSEGLIKKWKQFVRVITIDDCEEFEHYDEFVVFNFLEESNVHGFVWHPEQQRGVVASRDELLNLTHEFRHAAQTLEELDESLLRQMPDHHPRVTHVIPDKR